MSNAEGIYSEFTLIRIERKGLTLWITLDNPPMNAVTHAIHEELSRVFRVAAGDPDIRVIVLTGAGERAFCAGADLNALAAEANNHELWRVGMAEQREMICSILECDKPILARVNGHARGVGAILACFADISVACDEATFADSHVRVGLVAGDGGSIIFRHLIGLARAKRYLFTGDAMSAAEAVELGLITAAAPRDEFEKVTAEWVARLEKSAPIALQGTKRAINAPLRQEVQVLLDLHLGLETYSHSSSDFLEAVKAFLEKREPVFLGR